MQLGFLKLLITDCKLSFFAFIPAELFPNIENFPTNFDLCFTPPLLTLCFFNDFSPFALGSSFDSSFLTALAKIQTVGVGVDIDCSPGLKNSCFGSHGSTCTFFYYNLLETYILELWHVHIYIHDQSSSENHSFHNYSTSDRIVCFS